ncbi:MAG: ATP-binding cassette domain-containing protein [Steroidobacteraceae bacterium]|nr:ATP-binding cassette domain-containing protein [Steroidobacteraceae bacterium]
MLSVDLEYRRGSFELRARADLDSRVTGICGPSGCGKSTLLSLVAGLLRPDRGRLVLDGDVLVDTLTGVFVPAWQRHCALVFQDGQLFPHLTTRQNLLYGYSRRRPPERRFELSEVVELLEIGGLLDRRPAQLSGGERQRVALGRVLLYSPRVLLLDEPLASLDERLKQQILPFLSRVRDETGIPMLYVSHVNTEVDFLADRTLRMEAGRLLA